VVNEYHDQAGAHVLDNALDFAEDDQEIAELLRVAGDRWTLTTPLGLFCAERKIGTAIRYLVAHDPEELVGKIMQAES
jgi:hypothetical protein